METRPGRWWLASALGIATILAAGATAAEPRYQQLHLSWLVHAGVEPVPADALAPAARIDRLVLLERRRGLAHAPRSRRQGIGPEELAVVGVDAEGVERGRALVRDPRLLRSEAEDASGRLTRVDLVRPVASLLVTLPDDPDLRALRILAPRRQGGALAPEPLVTLELD